MISEENWLIKMPKSFPVTQPDSVKVFISAKLEIVTDDINIMKCKVFSF